jgi:hypothetical protein
VQIVGLTSQASLRLNGVRRLMCSVCANMVLHL